MGRRTSPTALSPYPASSLVCREAFEQVSWSDLPLLLFSDRAQRNGDFFLHLLLPFSILASPPSLPSGVMHHHHRREGGREGGSHPERDVAPEGKGGGGGESGSSRLDNLRGIPSVFPPSLLALRFPPSSSLLLTVIAERKRERERGLLLLLRPTSLSLPPISFFPSPPIN